MSEEGAKGTARNVLPLVRRGRKDLSEADPLPTVVMVPRPDREAREWADLALKSATKLEKQLDKETAAHAATRAALVEATAQAQTNFDAHALVQSELRAALAQINSLQAALAELRAHDNEQAVVLEKANGERWRLEEELSSMIDQAAAVDAHRQQAVRDLAAFQKKYAAIEKSLGERDAAISMLKAKLDTSAGAVLRQVEQRNKALEERAELGDRVETLEAQLERIRDAAR